MSTEAAARAPQDDTVVTRAILSQPLTDAENVVLATNWPGYTYGRCGRHGVIALPDANGAIRATGAIPCPTQGCSATTVLIADPISYLAERHITPMTFDEIAARLEAEGITTKMFVRELFPEDSRSYLGAERLPWLGPVKIVYHECNPKTKHEWKNEVVVFHLPAHKLYLRAHGTKETQEGKPASKKKWDYSQLHATKPQQVSSTKVEYY